MEAKERLDAISEIVRGKLNLTLAGKIELSAWPLDVLKIVANAFKPKAYGSPYAQFKRHLNAYSTANGIRLEWAKMKQLMAAMGVSEGAPKEETRSLNGAMNDSGAKKNKPLPVVGKDGKLFEAMPCTCHHKRFQVQYHPDDPNYAYFNDPAVRAEWSRQFEDLKQKGKIAATVPNPYGPIEDEESYITEQRRIQKLLEQDDIATLQQESEKTEQAIKEGRIPQEAQDILGTLNPFKKKLDYLQQSSTKPPSSSERLRHEQETRRKQFIEAHLRGTSPSILHKAQEKTTKEHAATYAQKTKELADLHKDMEANNTNTHEQPFVAKKSNLEAFDTVRKELEEKQAAQKLERLALAAQFLEEQKRTKSATFAALAITATPLKDEPHDLHVHAQTAHRETIDEATIRVDEASLIVSARESEPPPYDDNDTYEEVIEVPKTWRLPF